VTDDGVDGIAFSMLPALIVIALASVCVEPKSPTRLFPRATFAIGHGVNRDNRLEYVRGVYGFCSEGMVADLLHR